MVGALSRCGGARPLAEYRCLGPRTNPDAAGRSLCQRHSGPGHRRDGHTLMLDQLVHAIEWTFLAYFAAINIAYLGQCLFAVASVRRYLKSSASDDLDRAHSTGHLPISLVVPAYNES